MEIPFAFAREEWITAIEIINRQTTPHLQHQLPAMNMVTNDDIDNTENEYPGMNEVFARRPVRRRIEKECSLKECFSSASKLTILNI